MTDGGRGVALLAPFDATRYFLPWRPIRVSPIGVHGIFGPRGLAILGARSSGSGFRASLWRRSECSREKRAAAGNAAGMLADHRRFAPTTRGPIARRSNRSRARHLRRRRPPPDGAHRGSRSPLASRASRGEKPPARGVAGSCPRALPARARSGWRRAGIGARGLRTRPSRPPRLLRQFQGRAVGEHASATSSRTSRCMRPTTAARSRRTCAVRASSRPTPTSSTRCGGDGRLGGAPRCAESSGSFRRAAGVSGRALERATRASHPPRPGRPAAWIAGHGRVGLGHARLSIIDLTTGDQPIASEDERLHIVVNGEFYDYERIQRELEARAIACARAPTARSRCTSTRTSAPRASRSCAASSRSLLWDEAQPGALRRARPLRHQAALLRGARGHALPRLRGQGAVRGRRAGALEPRGDLPRRERRRAPDADPVRWRLAGPAGPLPARHAPDTRTLHRYWDFQLSARRRRAAPARDEENAERLARRRSTRRSGCGCAPTCRSAAT